MNKDIKKPNFFIIGAPKCGTTALSEYLREHPDIFIPRGENWVEMNYFNSDVNKGKRRFLGEDIDGYLSYFKEAPDDSLVGEKSVWYFYSKEAVSNILNFNSEAKFVVMLRNPADMYHSFYWHNINRTKEDAKTPEEAWRLQNDREKGFNLPSICVEPQTLQYGKVCSLGEQLERLYKQVPKEQVKVVFFDDLKSDTRKVYLDVLEFLGLSDDRKINFPKKNARKRPKSRSLMLFVKFLRKTKRRLGIKKTTRIFTWIKKIEMKKNRKELKNRTKLSEDFRKELLDYFNKDIDKLAELTGRDLSHWKEI